MNEPNQLGPTPDTDVQQFEAATLVPARRPTGLTVICVLAIVLGGLGTLTAVITGVQLAVGKQLQQSFQSMGNPDTELQKLQQEMQDEIWAVTKRFIVPNVVLAIAKFGLCAALLYAAIRTLQLRDSGRRLLAWICTLLIAFEITALIVFIVFESQVHPIMTKYMPEMMAGPNGGDAQAADFGAIAASGAIIFAIVVQAVWVLAKVIYYGVSLRYLRKPAIRELFEPAGS